MRTFASYLLIGCSAVALAGCGPDDIASPGAGSVVINNPTPTPGTGGTPTPPTGTVTAAAGCPTIADAQGLSDQGTISGPTGSYRVCRLPALIRTSTTLPKITGLVYEMNGRVNVGCDGGFTAPTAAFSSTTPGCTTPLTADTNVTLTIAPGAILYGNTGQSWLAVNRGNRIMAVGSATQPIVFTSRDNILGLNDDTSQGQWGGVVLMGRGRTTDCGTGLGTVASNNCERETEGSSDPARFGGTDDTYNAGRMSFVQIRYSGFVLGQNRELQALTGESIGSGTILDHIQAHNSSDDGAEFFGGAPQLKYYVASGADDDSLDVDTGALADVQYALLLQRPGRGDALMEIDSNGLETDVRRTRYRIANFTAIQPQSTSDNEGASGDLAATLFRGNSDTTLVNGIIATPANECVRLNSSSDAGSARATLTARSVLLQCNATKYLATTTGTNPPALTVGDVQAVFTGNNNNDAYSPTLATLFINGTTETNAIASDPRAITGSTFFDVTTWVGAVRNASDNWFAGWTCNTSYFTLSGGSACTSLPTT